MKKTILISVMLLFISSLMYSRANSGDYKLITVKSGEDANKIAAKYLKSRRYKKNLLRYNKISRVKAGMKLKIPYSLSKDRAAKIKYLKGRVHIKTGNSGWKVVRRAGTILLKSDRVKTSRGAKVEIQFDDGSVMKVGSNSVISLKEYSYSKKGRKANINLKNGSLFANVNKLRKKSSFKVSTVTAVAGVRGTQFYVSIDENNKVKIEVYEGKVEVAAKNKKVAVTANQQTTVESGSAPGEAVKIAVSRRIDWSR